jgi:hypothetical protein
MGSGRVVCDLDLEEKGGERHIYKPGMGSGRVVCVLDCLFTLLLSFPYVKGRG